MNDQRSPFNRLLRFFPLFKSILICKILTFVVLASTDESIQGLSGCPLGIAQLHGLTQEEYDRSYSSRYVDWMSKIGTLRPILIEGKTPQIFISHAWHESYYRSQEASEEVLAQSRYYDQMDFELAKILSKAGFKVLYDKDTTKAEGIAQEGDNTFMEKIQTVDVVLGICTPLYHQRGNIDGTGVHKEVKEIIKRCENGHIGFYIPLLLNAPNDKVEPRNLLVGHACSKMQESIYLDLRNSKEFPKHIWRILHRLWTNVKLKWDNSPLMDTTTHRLTWQYMTVLSDLLEDFKEFYTFDTLDTLKNELNMLRSFMTLSDKFDANEIAKCLSQEINVHKDLIGASKDHSIVVFLGNSGAGKSTLINLLMHRNLRADEFGQSYELADAENDNQFIKIGRGGNSETRYPAYVDVEGLRMFDLPGFSDSKGSLQDLVNAAFIHQIVVKSKNVRFVFVVGQDEINSQRGKSVKKLFNAMQWAFPSPNVIHQNSLFVVTKSTIPDLPTATRFWLSKLQSNAGTEFQTQLSVWKEKNRIFHMLHPLLLTQQSEGIEKLLRMQHKNETELSLLKSQMLSQLREMDPALQEDVQKFNISEFFSADTNVPLLNAFSVLLQEKFQECIQENKELKNLNEYINEYINVKEHPDFLKSLKRKMDEGITQDLENIKNYYNCYHYGPEDLYIRLKEIVMGFDNTRISLLKEIFGAPYNAGLNVFCEEKLSVFKKHYSQADTNLLLQNSFLVLLQEKFQECVQENEELKNLNEYINKQQDFVGSLKTKMDEGIIQDLGDIKNYYNDSPDDVEKQLKEIVMGFDNSRINLLKEIFSAPCNTAINVFCEKKLSVFKKHYSQFAEECVVYNLFINGKLIFDNEKGQRREFDIRQFANTLEGEFDLSGLTYTIGSNTHNVSDYLRIKIGVRSEQEDDSKVTCWLTPKFLLDMVSSHPWMCVEWKSPLGIFWSYGKWGLNIFDYLTTQQFDDISSKNLMKLGRDAVPVWRQCAVAVNDRGHRGLFEPELYVATKKFFLTF